MAERLLYLQNFGCQMNDYDVARMIEVLRKEGYALTEQREAADLIVINTCAIRENCENKVLSSAGLLRGLKQKKDVVIAIGGCVATQRGPSLLRAVPNADLIFGPDAIGRLPQLIDAARLGRKRLHAVDFIDVEDYEFLAAQPLPGDVKTTALVTIQ